ncbi:MAG: hypothetical protein LBK67_07790, partial [Coriobacteriales bacterium]|nr:hypothetical protein [Coriobacteriales bacterium]
DDTDILVLPDGGLDYSKAHQTVSSYDLNALEIAVQLKEAHEDTTVYALSVGSPEIDDSKLKKGILAKGVDELYFVADDDCAELSAYQTAAALVSLIDQTGEFDLILCGDGSADNYAQQVDVQLAAALDVPIISSAIAIKLDDDSVEVTRLLENELQTVRAALPAVISVVPDIAEPRIASMKDILAAGKKPQTMLGATSIGGVTASGVKTLSIKAPDAAPRKRELFNFTQEGDCDRFVAAVAAALR